jgi:hypothetical protein
MNGRWWYKGTFHSIYICAKSKMDAARMMQELSGSKGSPKSWLHEIDTYFSVGCWGNPMDGIPQERGAWIQKDRSNEKPRRIL